MSYLLAKCNSVLFDKIAYSFTFTVAKVGIKNETCIFGGAVFALCTMQTITQKEGEKNRYREEREKK